MTEYRDFIWKVGQAWSHTFTATDEDGDALALDVGELTMASHVFTVASTLDDLTHTMKLTNPTHTAAGLVTVTYDPVALAPGRYIYSLSTTNPALGDLYVVAQGTIVVERTAINVPAPAI